MSTKDVDLEELENPEAGQPKEPDSAENAPKKVRGRPITKETAKAMQLSSARAKKLRKETRMKMLNAMCTELDLGQELVKAVKQNDDVKIGIVEKALRIVGLTHEQSQEALAQKLEIKSENNNTHNGSLKLVIEDLTKPVDG